MSLSPFTEVSLELALNSRVSSGGGGDHFGNPSSKPVTPEQLQFILQSLRCIPRISSHPIRIRCEQGFFNPEDFTIDGKPFKFKPVKRFVFYLIEPSGKPNEMELNALWLDKGITLELSHILGSTAQVGVCILGGRGVELTPMIPYLSEEPPSGFQVGNLPEPLRNSSKPAIECIKNFRFNHSFNNETLNKREIGQVLWAGFGCTPHTTHSGDTGDPYRRQGKTIPSGNAIYDLVLYTLTEEGVAAYINWDSNRNMPTHSLKHLKKERLISELQKLYPDLPKAPLYIIAGSLGKLGRESAVMEAGYASINIALQTEALGLGCHIDALSLEKAEEIKERLSLKNSPTAVISIGHKAREDET